MPTAIENLQSALQSDLDQINVVKELVATAVAAEDAPRPEGNGGLDLGAASGRRTRMLHTIAQRLEAQRELRAELVREVAKI